MLGHNLKRHKTFENFILELMRSLFDATGKHNEEKATAWNFQASVELGIRPTNGLPEIHLLIGLSIRRCDTTSQV